ncbi:MAG: hypothetical protein CL978_00655 [Euryarchaeota archaeon]|nr:hypothetical protein [Euryarchaeota archaeon]
MRRKQPLEVDEKWRHPLPMPMPYQPVCVTELEALEQIAMLKFQPRVFIWTDEPRRCPKGWDYIASVRQGVPPQGIVAELDAWMEQYPDAWLAVDLRDGVIPPSTPNSLEQFLSELNRPILIIVSSSSDSEYWPQWVLPNV